MPFSDDKLSRTLVDFIRQCVPTLQAAEVLLFFANHPDGAFSAEEIVVAIRPFVATVPAVQDYIRLFVKAGLVAATPQGYVYAPVSGALAGAIGELGNAFNERPVTLITTIYKIADSKIQSFSDSFDLRGTDS